MKDDAPLGTFEEQVLVAILRTDQEAFGMNVRREIEDEVTKVNAQLAAEDHWKPQKPRSPGEVDVGEGI